MIRLFLIDDHQFIIDGIKRVMEGQSDIEVVGSTTNPTEGIKTLSSELPGVDVVICDISMPGVTGFEVLTQLQSLRPNLPIIMLTMHDDSENVVAVADAGAQGYLLKSGDPNHFVSAIRRVADGGTYFSAEIIHHLYRKVKAEKETIRDLQDFTDRELEILSLVLQERTSQEIADELFISKQTVDTHRKNILHKSGEKNLIGLVKFGLKNGLLEAPN